MELRAIYPDEANAAVESVMVQAGEQFELATIHFVIHELGRDDLAHLAVDGAAPKTNGTNALWLRAVMAVTGLQSCRLSAVRNAVASTAVDHKATCVQYVITVCSEAGASEVAMGDAAAKADDYALGSKLEPWIQKGCPLKLVPLHPLLLDVRCPSWAISAIASGGNTPSAIDAVYRNDTRLLEILRYDGVASVFEGARAAAVRTGNLPLLQWLLSNVPSPVESTLLDEALYYHQSRRG